MKNFWNKLIVASIFILILTLTVFVQKQKDNSLATIEDIKEDLKTAPCEDVDRLDAVKTVFKKMGASDEDLKVQAFDEGENLIITKKGKTDETVIIGAHFDKTSKGCGVIDNWSGIVIIANLYRRINSITPNKTYKFVAFGEEEKGLIGSKAFANSIPKDERKNHCAMINFDSFGFTYPQALGNASDESLIKIAKETSEDLEFKFGSQEVVGANSDSASFREIDVPAITFHGLSNNWKDYLHQDKDQQNNLKPESVYAGYIFSLKFLAQIDQADCGAFRQ